ncbi:DUF2306 domain-containing protein [Kitasatospora sp. RB6PN24]|uniref:DUF2306 domain-containing protein n=1 Tax=Kitasatospora humi TaxID=2893891 RepID=UPI001E5F8155|nr:DUF2306 domain-containing protein [Kitasatospora humi]MCC9309528.1 DUF2306 domain-containing protein [Kitasatospora humi]
MNRFRTIARPRVAVIAVVLLCLGYAPIAATELWPYAHPGAPAIGQWLLARTVPQRYVSEAFAGRVGPYRHSLTAMVVHSVLGGLLMVLGPVQLLSAVRRRIRLHRATGVLFAATVYLSMTGAAVYLLRTKPADAFSGPTFWIVLATILVGTVLSTTMGVIAALARRPDLHQRWMLLCYGYLMTAPLLRLEWVVLPLVFPGLPVTETNRIAVMHLGSVVVFGALVASRALDRRTEVPGVTGSWAPTPVLVAAQLLGVGSPGSAGSTSAGAPAATGCSCPTCCPTWSPGRSWRGRPGPPDAPDGRGPARSGGCTCSGSPWHPRSRSPSPCRSNGTSGWTGPPRSPRACPSAVVCSASGPPRWSPCASSTAARSSGGRP